MLELFRAIRLMGLPRLLKLRRGYQLGWDELIRGYTGTRIVQVMMEIGLIDELSAKGSLDVELFAKARDLDPQILNALCEAMYSMGFFERNGGTFSLTAKGHGILEALGGWLEVSCGYGEIFASLEPMLQKKKIYGRDFYRRSDFVARGSGRMNEAIIFPIAVDMIARRRYRKVLDLGCGDGTFLRGLCRANSEVTAYGFDLAPEAIAGGDAIAAKQGLANRIHLSVGDVCKLSEAEPIPGLDAATIFFVLHELLHTSEQLVIDFVAEFRGRFPGVPLLVFEAIRPTAEEMRKRPGIGIYYYLYHDLSHQKPVGREKWHELFKRAGCRAEERYLDYARIAVYTVH